MTPQEKAQQLIKSYSNYDHGSMIDEGELVPDEILQQQSAKKQCALICVVQIMAALKTMDWTDDLIHYWQQVKTEIEKL